MHFWRVAWSRMRCLHNQNHQITQDLFATISTSNWVLNGSQLFLPGNCLNALTFHTFQSNDDKWIPKSHIPIGFSQSLGTSIIARLVKSSKSSVSLKCPFEAARRSMRIMRFGWVCLQLCFVCECMWHDQTSPQGRHCCGPSPSQTWMSTALRNPVHET